MKKFKRCLCIMDYNEIYAPQKFKKGTYYHVMLESDGKYNWVVYNHAGKSGKSGVRFHIDDKKKDKNIGNVSYYGAYFKNDDRLEKLEKLKSIYES